MTDPKDPQPELDDTHVPGDVRLGWAHDTLPEPEPADQDTYVRSRPAPAAGPTPDGLQVTHEHAGRYAGEEEVGRGGLGRVSLTYDRHLARQVARKELLTGVAPGPEPRSGSQSQALARFLREARVTAQLEHPNIVPVYELGRRPEGALYYTMKLVRGRTLKAAIAAAHDMQDRLSLLSHFVDLCQAIAYAHSRGVIHRDIKPDNVMIGEFGETLVLDWGVAKLKGSEDLRGDDLARAVARLRDEEGAQTLPGAAFGTPVYMAPEQADGRIDDVDERSDVWALGVVLYQLLSGHIPYPDSHVLAVLVRASKAELVPLEEVCPDAPPELAAVVRRALAPDKAARYPSAKALADDVLAFQAGRRVEAYRYSVREVILRFVAEHRATVTVAAIAAAVLLVVLAGAYLGLREERDRARAAEAESRSHFADALVERARAHAQAHDWQAVELLAAEALTHSEHPAARGLLVAMQERLRPELAWSQRTYSGCAALAVAQDDLLCGASFGVARLAGVTGASEARLELPGGWVRALAVAEDGRLLAGGDGAEVVLFDRKGATLGRRRLPSPPLAAAFWGAAPVVVLEDGAVLRLIGAELNPKVLRPASEPLERAAAGPKAVVLADRLGHVTWHDGKKAVRIDPEHGGALTALAVSADGTQVATAGPDRAVRLFGADGQAVGPVRERGLGVVTALAFAGRALLAGTEDGEVALIDLEDRRVMARFAAHEGPVDQVVPVPGGLATAGRDRVVRRYRGTLPQPRGALDPRLVASGRGVALAADTGKVAFAGPWGLSLWDDAGPTTPVSSSAFESVALSADGRWLAAGTAGGGITWRAADTAAWTDVEPTAAPITALAFGDQAERLFAVAQDGVLWTVRLEDRAAQVLARGLPGTTKAIAADGAWLAVGAGSQAELRRADGTVAGRAKAMAADVTALALDADAGLLAVGDAEGELWLLSVPELTPRARLDAAPEALRALAFTAEGHLAALSAGGELRLYGLDVLRASPTRLRRELEEARGVHLEGLRPVPR
ncbi:MAG: protein kinase [Deltaproteobacteria bacterium]|nr:protein kinase [Deltaproteobacteria bacterium]